MTEAMSGNRRRDALRRAARARAARSFVADPAVWAWGVVALLALLPLRVALGSG